MPKRTDIQKILLIGSGPIVIGQGCEFDYSGVQACKVLKQDGFEVVLVNSNPATVMTDPELADRTYIEPLTCDILHEIIRRERPDAILPTLGGQTALNLAMELNKNGILKRYHVELIGARKARRPRSPAPSAPGRSSSVPGSRSAARAAASRTTRRSSPRSSGAAWKPA